MKPKKIPFKLFKEIYSQVPRLSVELLVQEGNGFVFSLRSMYPNEGKWHIPGGTILFGESVEEAVNRVAHEELGIKVKIEKLVGYIEYPKNFRERYDWAIGIAFLVKRKAGKLVGSRQGEEVKIFDKIPENIIVDQKDFLLKKKLLSV